MGIDFRLYLITDRNAAAKPLPEAVRLALEGGVRAVQLREKDLPVRGLLALAEELRSLTREFGAKLFINDRVDVAVAVGADGVHLGGQSMPPDAVRTIVGITMLIGVSAHSVQEAEAAQAGGADLITLGPIFETPSKRHYGPPLGPDSIGKVKQAVGIPVFALGGINSRNMPQALNAGADGIAMISAVLAAEDIRGTAAGLVGAVTTATKTERSEQCASR